MRKGRRPRKRSGASTSSSEVQEAAAPEERAAVYGATADEPERHFLGWLGEVDTDQLFASGAAWGITVVRRQTRE